MSSSSANSGFVSFMSLAVLDNLMGIGAVTLLVYEHIINLDKEIQYVWLRKKTGAAVLYLIIRYMALFTLVILEVISYVVPMSDASCTAYTKWWAPLEYLQYIVWAAFSALRTLALSNMNWTLASSVFVIACIPAAVNFWSVARFGVVGESIPTIGCVGASQPTVSQLRVALVIARGSDIISGMIVVAVTWKYAGMSRAIRNVQGSVPSMVQVMVLNGTIYFLALVILNALHLSITLLAFPLNTGAAGEVLNSVSQVTIFTDPITVVLLCRFLLDLQSTNTRLLEHDVSTSQLDENGNIIGGTLRFATVVADSMGGTIAPDTIENMMHDDTGNGWE